jgi:uncharacterized protein YndB with AHSA1/START domain
MPKFERTLDIARPLVDVFAYLTDASKLPEWQSTAVAASTDGPVQPGTGIHERRRFLGREVQMELEVTRYEPPGRFDAKSRSRPVRLEIRHALEPSRPLDGKKGEKSPPRRALPVAAATARREKAPPRSRHANRGAVSGLRGVDRGGGTRTPDLRFWRPPLYQLSYAPAFLLAGL